MNQKNAGFSLIELLIVVVIMGLAISFILRLTGQISKSDARLTEVSEAVNRNSILTDVMQKDFADPLHLLSSSSLLSSGTFAVEFENHWDFQITSGFAKRDYANDTTPVFSSLVLETGTAQASYIPDSNIKTTYGWRTVGTASASQTIEIIFDGSKWSYLILRDNGAEKDGIIEKPFSRIETTVEQLSIGCRIGFYAVTATDRILLNRGQQECPQMPLEIIGNADLNGVISQAQMTGQFSSRETLGSSSRIAPLPYVGTNQVSTPVFVNPENGDVVLFRADQATDKTFTETPAVFNPLQNTVVTIKPPARGSFKGGDYVFVVDYINSLSVVCRIVDFSDDTVNGTLLLTLTPAYTSTDAAWGLFYSRSDEFSGRSFSQGADVLNLAAPVQYRYYATDKMVMRREGSGLWETVAPGVSAYTATVSGNYLNISATVNTEGIEIYNQASDVTNIRIPIR